MYAFQFLKIRNHHTICILNLELTENIDGNWSSIRPPNTVSGATLQSIVAPQWNSINTEIRFSSNNFRISWQRPEVFQNYYRVCLYNFTVDFYFPANINIQDFGRCNPGNGFVYSWFRKKTLIFKNCNRVNT